MSFPPGPGRSGIRMMGIRSHPPSRSAPSSPLGIRWAAVNFTLKPLTSVVAPWGRLPGSAMSSHVRLPVVVQEEPRLNHRTCETGTLAGHPREPVDESEYRNPQRNTWPKLLNSAIALLCWEEDGRMGGKLRPESQNPPGRKGDLELMIPYSPAGKVIYPARIRTWQRVGFPPIGLR